MIFFFVFFNFLDFLVSVLLSTHIGRFSVSCMPDILVSVLQSAQVERFSVSRMPDILVSVLLSPQVERFSVSCMWYFETGNVGAVQHVPKAVLECGGQVWGQSQSEHRVAWPSLGPEPIRASRAWPSLGPGSAALLSAKTSLLTLYSSTGHFTA